MFLYNKYGKDIIAENSCELREKVTVEKDLTVRYWI